jgi:hypothetical protein
MKNIEKRNKIDQKMSLNATFDPQKGRFNTMPKQCDPASPLRV